MPVPGLLGADAEQHQHEQRDQQSAIAARERDRPFGTQIVGNFVKNINDVP